MSIKNFGGYLSRHTNESPVTKGVATVVSSPASKWRHMDRVLELTGSPTIVPEVILTDAGEITDEYIIVGGYFRFIDTSPSTDKEFISFENMSAIRHCGISYTTFGRLKITDAAGATSFGGVPSHMNVDTWYLIEVLVRIAESGSGTCDVFLDGRLVVSTTGDFRASETKTNVFILGNIIGGSPETIFVDVFYVDSDPTGFSPRVGEHSAFMYRKDEVTAVPDFGSTLDISTWDKAANFSDIDGASYTTSGNKGVVETNYGGGSETPGPKGHGAVGAIQAASWYFRYSVGFFGPATIELFIGAGDGSDSTVSKGTVATGSEKYFVEGGANVPSEVEYMQWGFKKVSGSSTALIKDNFACILSQHRRVHLGSAWVGSIGRSILVG